MSVSLTLRIPTGRPLTNVEVDNNFIALGSAVESVKESPINVVDDTTTTTPLYLLFSTSSNTSIKEVKTSTTGLTYVPQTGTLNVPNLNSVSDEKLKTDILNITNALDTVLQLSGKTFTFTNSGVKSAGVIAQEIQNVIPFAVTENNDVLSVAYNTIIPYLIESIKELKSEIDELKSKAE